jgi:hypothetical protein
MCVCVCVRVRVCGSDEYNSNGPDEGEIVSAGLSRAYGCNRNGDKVQVRTKQQRVEM